MYPVPRVTFNNDRFSCSFEEWFWDICCRETGALRTKWKNNYVAHAVRVVCKACKTQTGQVFPYPENLLYPLLEAMIARSDVREMSKRQLKFDSHFVSFDRGWVSCCLRNYMWMFRENLRYQFRTKLIRWPAKKRKKIWHDVTVFIWILQACAHPNPVISRRMWTFYNRLMNRTNKEYAGALRLIG